MKGILIKSYTKQQEKLLISRGVPYVDLVPKRTLINVQDALVRIEPDIPKVIPKTVSVVKQLKGIQAILDRPLRGSYTVGISSFPTDLRAKYLAQLIMLRAIEQHTLAKKNGKVLPMWHRLYGGLVDVLRDKQSENPCMLILCNINENSTSIKIEKCRDLLEKFSDIPRIVINGGEPCCNLFANTLRYPLKYALHLGPDNRVQNI